MFLKFGNFVNQKYLVRQINEATLYNFFNYLSIVSNKTKHTSENPSLCPLVIIHAIQTISAWRKRESMEAENMFWFY